MLVLSLTVLHSVSLLNLAGVFFEDFLGLVSSVSRFFLRTHQGPWSSNVLFELTSGLHRYPFLTRLSLKNQKWLEGISTTLWKFGMDPCSQILHVPPIHRPSKILDRPSKTMHSAASLRKKGKTPSLPLHAYSKHMGRRKVLLGQGIF